MDQITEAAKDVFKRAKEQASSMESEQSGTGKAIELCKYCGKFNAPCPTESCRNKARFDSKPLKALKGVLVPPLYIESFKRTFTGINLDAQNIAEQAEHGGIFLHGATGTGKTTLATSIFTSRIPKTIGKTMGSRWSTMTGILSDIRDTYNSGANKTENDVIKEYSDFPLLLIDDLGAEKITDWSISALYSILSTRINYMRYTIVTSNLDLKDIHDWNPRIASRLAGLQVHKMAGSDRRINGQ